MTKFEIAHAYFMKHANTDQYRNTSDSDLVMYAWQYADAMQAEADEREDKTRPEVLEEWQPDWSQAPEDATAWEYLGHGSARWHTTTKGMYRAADLFGYSGTDMLFVERPQ